MHDRTTTQLLALAREALALVARRPAGDPDLYWTLGALRQVLEALDGALDGIARDLVEQGRAGTVAVVEGPFVGEPVEATRTAQQWLDRARLALAAGPAAAVDNAQIAASGLARAV